MNVNIRAMLKLPVHVFVTIDRISDDVTLCLPVPKFLFIPLHLLKTNFQTTEKAFFNDILKKFFALTENSRSQE